MESPTRCCTVRLSPVLRRQDTLDGKFVDVEAAAGNALGVVFGKRGLFAKIDMTAVRRRPDHHRTDRQGHFPVTPFQPVPIQRHDEITDVPIVQAAAMTDEIGLIIDIDG